MKKYLIWIILALILIFPHFAPRAEEFIAIAFPNKNQTLGDFVSGKTALFRFNSVYIDGEVASADEAFEILKNIPVKAVSQRDFSESGEYIRIVFDCSDRLGVRGNRYIYVRIFSDCAAVTMHCRSLTSQAGFWDRVSPFRLLFPPMTVKRYFEVIL